MSDIPDWAIERACAMFNEANHNGPWDSSLNRGNPVVMTFAAYIAAHEDPPVDPLVDALADAMLCVFEDGFSGWAPAIAEYAPKLRDELARRGINIGDQS